MVFSSEFITLYVGSKYQQSAIVITLLMAAYPFTSPSTMTLNLAMATARVRPYFAGTIVTQLIHLATMIYLVKWHSMGAVGIALATFITATLSQMLYFWPMGLHLANISVTRFARETLIPGLLPAIAGLAVWLSLNRYRTVETWTDLFVYTVFGVIAYGFVLFKFCLQNKEKKDLVKAIKHIKDLLKK